MYLLEEYFTHSDELVSNKIGDLNQNWDKLADTLAGWAMNEYFEISIYVHILSKTEPGYVYPNSEELSDEFMFPWCAKLLELAKDLHRDFPQLHQDLCLYYAYCGATAPILTRFDELLSEVVVGMRVFTDRVTPHRREWLDLSEALQAELAHLEVVTGVSKHDADAVRTRIQLGVKQLVTDWETAIYQVTDQVEEDLAKHFTFVRAAPVETDA